MFQENDMAVEKNSPTSEKKSLDEQEKIGERCQNGVSPESSESGEAHEAREEAMTMTGPTESPKDNASPKTVRRKLRRRKRDSLEAQLQGRRDLCYRIEQVVPRMLKMVMTRVAASQLRSTKGLSEEQLRAELLRAKPQITDNNRVKAVMTFLDPERHRRILKGILVFDVLLEEERYALPSKVLERKVGEYEKQIVKEAKGCELLDPKKMDKNRLSVYETYNVVLDAAWRHEDRISIDEANLLAELRRRLDITLREHRLLEARMGRFPKRKSSLHSYEEIEDTKRQLQKEGILWTFRDENGRDIDAIPFEIMETIRSEMKQIQLQKVNFKRLLDNKALSNTDLRGMLKGRQAAKYGARAEMIESVLASRITPHGILESADLAKLQVLCREVGLVAYGSKAEVVNRLISFYDNLTFEPIVEQDERARWYAAYELLAARKYSELKAQGLIDKQEHVDKAFEKATDFLFEKRLKATIEKKLPTKSADGKIYLHSKQQVILWDCKSDEREVNIQDHLETQFDGYMRAEAREGRHILYFLVIAPRYTKKSLAVAQRYKMTTDWDVALITASALKKMTEKWHDAKPDHPFPLELLNLTDLVDEERVDELLSLVL